MNPSKIPVIVLTGFLGSGKTTLLNRLLADGVKTAVVINEFGNTPVDQDLLSDQNIPMTVLSGGCLCCQIKGALAPTLKNLWMAWNSAAIKPFDRIIIETSGVASPEPILDTLLRERWLASRYHLAAVITTLAIPSALQQLDDFAEARAQVVWADTLLLTHADLAAADQDAALNKRLQTLAPATSRHMMTDGECQSGDRITNIGPALRRLPTGNPLPAHNFASISLHLDQALPWLQLEAILQELLARHPLDLLRIKGVVYLPEQAEALAVQAAANRLYPPTPLTIRSSDDRRGRLVFITSGDSKTLAEELTGIFAGFIPPNAIRQH
ncbi:CobW family GTP-binding protein [Methylomonas albis]|uniref:GTP-binding protein n=1 Tax=Methylomonas albis TaxID=1854563 RepID=A0ABR9D338_9GAMM|nr:CobW family GTP-binding protein [Methylomonas albis]MBD9357206.1 GTP-binding protein [Methylomonas albis]